jgi:hypothetical protein
MFLKCTLNLKASMSLPSIQLQTLHHICISNMSSPMTNSIFGSRLAHVSWKTLDLSYDFQGFFSRYSFCRSVGRNATIKSHGPKMNATRNCGPRRFQVSAIRRTRGTYEIARGNNGQLQNCIQWSTKKQPNLKFLGIKLGPIVVGKINKDK